MDVLITDDGARDALVEQAGVEQEHPVFRLGLHLLPVHVRHIGDQLEGIKGDADG